ncbi:MAG: hypothetical protein WBP12_03475 [Candidatus Saccharimonas sp.]
MQENKPTPQRLPQQDQRPAGSIVPPTAPAGSQGDYLHPIDNGPKKVYHPKRTIIIMSILVVASLLVVGLLVLYAIRPTKIMQSAETPDKEEKVETLEPLTASDTLKLVQVHLTNPIAAKQAITLPVVAPKKKFYTVIPEDTPVEGTSAPVTPGEVSKTQGEILKVFTDNKFTKSERRERNDPMGYLAYFTREDVICQLTITPSSTEAEPRAFQVDCTDIAHYTEYADAQQPLASIYTPANTASTYVAFTGKPQLKPSQTAGYNLVEIPVSTVIDQRLTSTGTLALFYQSPDSLWHYFLDRDTGVAVDCSKYKQTALLYAYAGQVCSITNSNKTNVVTAPKSR